MNPRTPLILMLLAAPALAGEDSSLWVLHRIKTDAERKIQTQVLDPILGRGRAFAFAEVELDLAQDRERTLKDGEGRAIKLNRPADGVDGAWGSLSAPAESESGERSLREETARQRRTQEERRTRLEMRRAALRLRILHDEALAPERLDAARAALTRVYGGAIRPDGIEMLGVPFAAGAGDADGGITSRPSPAGDRRSRIP